MLTSRLREIEVVHHLVDPGVVGAQTEVTRLNAKVSRTVKKGSNTSSCGTTPSAARADGIRDHIVPRDARAAAVGARQSGKHVDQRRLAGAVRTEQTEEFPAPDLEIDAGERLQCAEALVHPRISIAGVMRGAVAGGRISGRIGSTDTA